ncbi:MAG: FxLYD domain-containing protein [bacterium]|nr:FxLYD domain-containing protein [bacterium]
MNHSIHTLIALLCVFALTATAYSQELEKKVKVSVTWKRHGSDVHVTATVHNLSGKKLIDPIVRVRFYDKDDQEVASASKAYFTTLGKGAKKRLETRTWSEIDTTAVRAEGSLDISLFQ